MHRTAIGLFLFIQLSLVTRVLAEDCVAHYSRSFVELEYGKYQQESLQHYPDVDVTAQNIRFDARHRLTSFTSEKQEIFAGVAYEYRPVDMNGVHLSPQTNGYLHTLQIPLQWQLQGNGSRQYINATLAIATSSNGFQHPNELQSENLQLRLAWAKTNELAEHSDWLLGVCANHLFGQYRVYPLFGVQTRVGDNINLRLAFPHSSVEWQIHNKILINLELGPAGREWHIFNKDFTHESDYVWKAWQFDMNLQWQLASEWRLAFNAGYRFAQELEFQLQNDEQLAAEVENSGLLSVKLIKHW